MATKFLSTCKNPSDYLFTCPKMRSSMALIRLPDSISGNETNYKTSCDAKALQDFLYDHMIEVPIKCIANRLYVRISFHVYNKADEYDKLGIIINKLANGMI